MARATLLAPDGQKKRETGLPTRKYTTEPLSITITERRMRYAGHVLRMTSDRHAKTSMFWKPEGKRKRGRPKLTWRRTLQKDLESKGVSLKDAESLAKDRAEWRRLAAQCALHGRN
ncbi:hypothetical protein Bbelb_208860 [Branchiostoma belcheri]|nr:hypothetical protein Bbelb_208860 [Branchiostoma belcheri]